MKHKTHATNLDTSINLVVYVLEKHPKESKFYGTWYIDMVIKDIFNNICIIKVILKL